MEASRATSVAEPHKPFYTHLYAQVLTAIVIGVLLGHFYPQLGEQMKPLGDGFVKMIKMLIAPIIFCTVVHGIASMEDMKKVGRVGLKALIYFEITTTPAARRGDERRPEGARYQINPNLHDQGRPTEHGRISHAYHSEYRRRSIC